MGISFRLFNAIRSASPWSRPMRWWMFGLSCITCRSSLAPSLPSGGSPCLYACSGSQEPCNCHCSLKVIEQGPLGRYCGSQLRRCYREGKMPHPRVCCTPAMAGTSVTIYAEMNALFAGSWGLRDGHLRQSDWLANGTWPCQSVLFAASWMYQATSRVSPSCSGDGVSLLGNLAGYSSRESLMGLLRLIRLRSAWSEEAELPDVLGTGRAWDWLKAGLGNFLRYLNIAMTSRTEH